MTTDTTGMTSSAHTIRLTLAYEGTRYSGWQSQPGQATVQGVLAEAIRGVTGEAIVPRGSSRTDSGVHALGQVVAFTTTSNLGPEVWVEVVGNGFLYNMVRIITGSLVMVGSGKRRPEWIREVIAARSRPAAGPTAPPQGLVLVSIELDLGVSNSPDSSNPAPAWQESLNSSEN